MKKLSFRLYYVLGLIWGISLFLDNGVCAQPAGTVNFLNQIKNYNLANLWKADLLRLLSLKENESFPRPLGILGEHCQRFYIHYNSINKDSANPYCYNVQGKTRLGNQVRTFTGTITIIKAGLFMQGKNNSYASESYKGYKRGRLICRVVFNEAVSAPGSGDIKGELTTDFCINAQNQLLYDTLDYGIDGYGNNQFVGIRTVNSSKSVQKLQYGDITITNSKFSDVDGITVPSEFEKYGWQSYVNAISNDLRPASKAALVEEKRQWWK